MPTYLLFFPLAVVFCCEQKGLSFLNKDCSLCHNSVCMAAVFVDVSGEWKLGAFDYLHASTDPRPQPMLSQLQKYLPPEDGKGGKMKEKW